MNGLKSFYQKYLHNWIGLCALVAILINLIIETLARQNGYGGVLFMIQHPLRFLYCALIIFTCISVSVLFRHRMFFMTLIGAVWLGFGIVNGVILSQRMTPFTTTDLQELKDGLSLATTYFSGGQITLIIGIIAVVALLIVLLFRKAPKKKEKVEYKKSIAAFLIIVMMGGTTVLFTKAEIIDTYFPNLAYGYRDNGFTYCFMATWLDKGIKKPAGYSASEVKDIFTKKERETQVGANQSDGSEKHPNIIFIQLESFVDPTIAKDVKFSKDPIPYVRKLMSKYSTGHLTVPVVGAGTANTEFESITGLSARFFGPGEYPYRSILSDETCESIPYDLKKIGYSTHAIHNHRGIFYNRNTVFPDLGFDTFTSLEYMNNVTKTPKGWAKDYVLTSQITDALKSTKGSDYIYTVSVQGHGQYPTDEVLTNPEIKVTKAPSDELKNQWEYYVNQEYEMDQFVQQLLAKLKKMDENTVVVFYGDHLPGMSNLTDDNIVSGRSIYQTDYVLWSNFKMAKKDSTQHAYQLGSYVLGRLGIHNGTMVAYHQDHRNDKNYWKDLGVLEYDMLYGKKYIYNGKNPFKTVDMKMGVKDIRIEKVVKIGTKYYIKGKNFTESSKITMDGKVLKTVYLGPTILGLKEEVDPKDVTKMTVSQVDKTDDTILSTCE